MSKTVQLAIHKSDDSEVVIGRLRFRACRREIEGIDGGVTLQVMGPVGRDESQLLRFDCFRRSPHYHAPGEDPRETKIDVVARGDAREWVYAQLATQLDRLLDQGGFGSLAATLDLSDYEDLAPRLQTMVDALPEPSETSYVEIDAALLEGANLQAE